MGVIMVYKPSYNWGTPSCMGISTSMEDPIRAPDALGAALGSRRQATRNIQETFGMWNIMCIHVYRHYLYNTYNIYIIIYTY
jgi:hypothetical protein